MKLNFRNIAVNVLMVGLFCGVAIGQSATAKQRTKPAPKKETKTQSGWEKTWYVKAKLFTTFDSNFDKEPIATKSVGVIPSADFGYQLQKDRHRVQFQYSIGYPRYSKFAEYNKLGQYFRGSYRNTLGKGWNSETEFETLLRGLDEDREQNNQFIVTQKFNYRLTKKDKLGFYGVYRLKRQSVDPNADAKNPQVGVKYTRQLTNKLEAYGGFRYDKNIARGLRQRYNRQTISAGFDFEATKRDKIGFEARYAPRNYTNRLTEVNGVDVSRSDKKYTFDFKWRHDFTSRFGVEANYQFEKRTSNELDKIYHNNQIVIALYYRWGNGDN